MNRAVSSISCLTRHHHPGASRHGQNRDTHQWAAQGVILLRIAGSGGSLDLAYHSDVDGAAGDSLVGLW